MFYRLHLMVEGSLITDINSLRESSQINWTNIWNQSIRSFIDPSQSQYKFVFSTKCFITCNTVSLIHTTSAHSIQVFIFAPINWKDVCCDAEVTVTWWNCAIITPGDSVWFGMVTSLFIQRSADRQTAGVKSMMVTETKNTNTNLILII